MVDFPGAKAFLELKTTKKLFSSISISWTDAYNVIPRAVL